jgi:uncharacterized protein (TIGR03067 family)
MAFLLLALHAVLFPVTDDPPTKQMDALQGTWLAVALQDEDRHAPVTVIKQFRLVIKGDKMTFAVEGPGEAREAEFRLDPKQDPPAIDVTFPQSKPLPGIYKLEGDKLTICLPTKTDGKTVRPKSFECKKGSGLGLFVVKKKMD